MKYILADDSWLLIRPSGTEPVLRVYAEGRSLEMVKALMSFGEQAQGGLPLSSGHLEAELPVRRTIREWPSLPDASRAGLSFARRRVEGAPVDAPRMAVL